MFYTLQRGVIMFHMQHKKLKPSAQHVSIIKVKRFCSVCSISTGVLWDLGQGVLFLWRKSLKLSSRLASGCIQKDEGWLIKPLVL